MAKTKKTLGPTLPDSPAMPGIVASEKRMPRSRVSLRLDRAHGSAMPGVKIGQKHSMRVSGRVTSLSSDEYGHNVEMDVQPKGISHDPDDTVPQSLTQAMKRRNRHMQSGKFV